MEFNQKLDLLMNITRTTNSALALYTALDASHISRLRRGERKPAKNASYVKAMAAYFCRQCVEDYQKKALTEALHKPAAVMQDPEKMAELVYHWLLDEKQSETTVVESFLDGLSHFQFKNKQSRDESHSRTDIHVTATDVSIHYGVEGKRKAVLEFLSLVLYAQKTHVLLLYSDEDMEWLTGDPSFTAKWADLLSQVIMRGNRIKIIHTVSRNLDEMLEALSKWTPLYMTGAIEPYYYPKKRDGIFKRTLFVAPETAAVISTSVGMMTENAANFLLNDAKAVEAISEEFLGYLTLCKPLMRIFAPNDRIEYLRTLHEFEKESAEAIIKTGALSLVTMPIDVAEAMIARIKGNRNKELLNYFRAREQGFENGLRDCCFTEIIKVPDVSMIKEGKVGIGFSGMLGVEELFYTIDEFRQHLENIIALLQTNKNYQVCIDNDIKEDGYMLYVKEDLGAIVVKRSDPFAIFVINESNMTAAFWDFLKSKIDNRRLNKEKVIIELQSVIGELK